MAFISLGTPGKVKIVKPLIGSHIIPGAVPLGLLIICAFFGKKHCFFKLEFRFVLESASFFLISSHKYSRSESSALKDLAIASVVKSSGVGPKPPVVI